MDIARDLESLNAALAPHRGRRVALVPTMGALHAGHRALLRAARGAADVVVASVFVNPLQFNNARDFERYPRDLEADANVLHEERCAVLWAPPEAVMYPEGFSVMVRAGGAAQEFEGAHRPGHFDGVATVIAKLFNQIRPDIAVFGEKDWQQLAVVRQLIKDLNFSLQVLGVPVERDAHGLALSSRNALLSEQGLAVARRLNAVLRTGGGEAELLAAGFEAVDYVGTLDGRTVAAVWVEGVRLIDAITTPGA
jgi:pantoate--beta-alanine ligase